MDVLDQILRDIERHELRSLVVDAFFLGWLVGMASAGIIWAIVAISE